MHTNSSLTCRQFLVTLLLVAATAFAAEPPKSWAPDAFLPLTAERIAALPAAEQPAWRAYWDASVARTKLLPERDLVDHSSTKPLAGPPIGSSYSKGVRLGAPAAFYATEEARTIADHVVNWQTVVGGWVKSGDYSRDRKPEDDHHDFWSAGTFDNDSTIHEMRYLALVSAAGGGDARVRAWRESFLRGLDYSLAAQYPNGGFPQIYPLSGWYHDAITFNDDAMVHILELFRDIGEGKAEFAFVPAAQTELARVRLERGIQCVLATQIKTSDGHHRVWGQQCDPLTLQPCAARNFEPVSECSAESAGLVAFLMTVPHPSPAIVAAVEDAMKWFPRVALHGVAWNRDLVEGTGLVPRNGAPDLWARFYELGTEKPVFGDRDRTIHYAVTELSNERRRGYSWYNSHAAIVFEPYAAWHKKFGAAK